MNRLPRPETVLAVLWPLILLSILYPLEAVRQITAVLLVAYLVLSVFHLRWQIWLVCSMLAALTVGLCLRFGGWEAIPNGLERAVIIAGFLPTVMLLRATAEHRPEVAAAARLFAARDEKAQNRGILVGSHILGSILIVGIFALLAPVLGANANVEDRRRFAGIGLRGLCLAVLWSPFFVGMGLVNEYLPDVELAQILPFGLGLAALGLLTSHLMFDRSGGLMGLLQAVTAFSPVMPLVGIAAAAIVLLTSTTTLGTLQALILGMPALCVLVLLTMGGARLTHAARRTWEGFGHLGNEMSIMTLAIVLGVVVETILDSGASANLRGFIPASPPVVIALTLAIITAGGLLALHPIITATVLLALLRSAETGVSDLVLMQTVLVGWALSTMISVSGVAITTASALFSLSPERLVRGQNLLFVVVFGTLSVFILALVNYAIRT